MSILSRRAGSKLQGAVQGVAGSFGGMASIVYSIGVASFLISAGVISVVFVIFSTIERENRCRVSESTAAHLLYKTPNLYNIK